MIKFSKKIILLSIFLSCHVTYTMKSKYMSYGMDVTFASKFIAFKNMQLNGDKQGLETRINELNAIIEEQWWGQSKLYEEKKYIESLLQSPITHTIDIIKNSDLDAAIDAFNNLKDSTKLSPEEVKAVQTALESRSDYTNKSKIGTTKQKLYENKNAQTQNNAVSTQSTHNHIKPTYAFDNIVDFENDTMKLYKINIQENSTCASSVNINNSEKTSHNSAHYNYVYANAPSSYVNTNDSHNTQNVCDNKIYASAYDSRFKGATFIVTNAKTQGHDNKNNHVDSAPYFNNKTSLYIEKNINNAISSEFKKMQLNGDKKGLIAKKKELEAALKNAWFFTSGIQAQIDEINILLESPITETLFIIRDADFYTACITFYSFEKSILGISEEGVFNMKAYDLEESEQEALNAAREIFQSRSEYQLPYSPTYGDIGVQVTNQSKVQKNNANKSAKDSLVQINKSTAVDNQKVMFNNEQNSAHIDSLDMVSTTISQDTLTITPEANQRITETFNTLNNNSLETISSYTKTLAVMLKEQKLDAQTNGKCFEVGIKSCSFLQKYAENPTKRIVGQSDINKNILHARKEALISVSNNPTECSEQFYTLNSDICTILKSYGINPNPYTYCLGNAVQQQFHKEVVTILNEMVNIPLNASTQPFLDVVITCTHVGNVYAQENNIEKAFSLADCAWAALDCANVGFDNEIDLTQKAKVDRDIKIAKGIVHGLQNAVANTANMVLDPIGTISNIGNALGHFTLCLMDIASLTEDDFLTFNLDNSKNIEENAQIRREKIDSIIDAVKKTTLEERTAFVTEQIVSCLIMDLGISAIKHCAKASAIPLARLGKVITDKTPNQIPKAFSAIRQEIIDTLSNFTKAEHVVATTAEGIEITVSASEEASTFNAMAKQHGHNHNKRPTFNDIKNEVLKNSPTEIEKASTTLGVNNIKEFFQTDFGKLLKNSSIKTNRTYDGQAIYKITENIKDSVLKKGYHFYLDALHFNHIEVFDARGNFLGAYNLNGTWIDAGKKVGRRI